MKWFVLILFMGGIVMSGMVNALFFDKNPYYIIQGNASGNGTTILNNTIIYNNTFNQTFNTTINTSIYLNNISNNSFSCNGTDKLVNVSIDSNALLSGMCQADSVQTYGAQQPWLFLLGNTFNFNVSRLQDDYYNKSFLDPYLVSGGNRIFWLTNQTNFNGTLNVSSILPSNSSLANITVSLGAGNPVTVNVARLITQAMDNTTFFDAGVVHAHLMMGVADANRIVSIRMFAFFCVNYTVSNDSCQSFIPIANSTSTDLTNLITDEHLTSFIPELFALNPSDRIIVFLNATKTSGLATTVTLQVGDLSYSRVEIPSPVGVTDISSKLDKTDQRYNETNYINSLLSTITYYPKSFIVNGNNISGNNIGNLSFIDNQYFITSEFNGVNPESIIINYTVNGSFNNIQFLGQYNGTHSIALQLWDVNGSVWETYNTINPSTSPDFQNIAVPDYLAHINASNNLTQLRFVHNGNGVAGQTFQIDEIVLQSGLVLTSNSVPPEVDPIFRYDNSSVLVHKNSSMDVWDAQINWFNITGRPVLNESLLQSRIDANSTSFITMIQQNDTAQWSAINDLNKSKIQNGTTYSSPKINVTILIANTYCLNNNCSINISVNGSYESIWYNKERNRTFVN